MLKKILILFIISISVIICLGGSRSETATSQFIIINKSTNTLAYYENGKIVKTFKVATGKKASYTPEGKFKIVNKIKNRPYYAGNIPGGDPRNPLGNRWLGLNARGTWGTTYAIHGNNNPSSIGKYVSAGCIRMYNDEVKWLYDRVKVNTPVVITTSKKSFDDIAKANGLISTKSSKQASQPSKQQAISTVKKGSRGNDVKVVQQKLKKLGYSIAADGIFGPKTDSAVRKFQKSKGLKVNGIVDLATQKALGLK